jgi:hypothetical protein
MYYYRRKTNPLKWIIIALAVIAIGGFSYWFYINYFSKIEFPEPESIPEEKPVEVKFLSVKLAESQGEVQLDFSNKGYQAANADAILHQGDKIKTRAKSWAILKFDDGSVIRLADNTEIILQTLENDNILLEQKSGRTYHNLAIQNKYQLKYANVLATALGTIFELITDEQKNYAAVIVLENKVRVEILNQDEVLLSGLIESNEKALIDLNAAKKDKFKIEVFDPKILAKEAWYKWNFDQDKGLDGKLIEEEPDFSTTTESLELAAEAKENGVYLSWSVYNQDDFKNYKIVRSEKNVELKYPDDELIKSSASKDFNSYLDTKIEKGKKYYYRVCVLKQNDKVLCGNVSNVEIAKEEKDMTAPAAPLLSVRVTVDGANLNWTANTEEDFAEYRVLKSLTNPSPTVPSIGYLAIKNKGQENYLDKEVNITSAGNVYYRVCSLDTSGNSACSNVVTVENGQVK